MKYILLAALVFTLASCGGGGSSSNPTDPATNFQVRPLYTQVGYTPVTVSFTGFVDGKSVSATATTRNLGISANRVNVRTDVSVTVGANTENFYTLEAWSIDSSTAYSYYSSSGGELYLAQSSTPLPYLTTIGSSGRVGTYVSDWDFTDVITWALSDAGNGNAVFTVTKTTTDNLDNGSFFSTETTANTITPEGAVIQSVSSIRYYDNTSFTITGYPM